MLASAPTDSTAEINTLRQPLRPVTAWGLSDVHFAFDSSVVLPSMVADLGRLRLLLLRFPGHPIAIFGHTDATGNDEYNKLLSGRRAMALYGLLTRKVEHWEKLFGTAVGGDDWKKLGVLDKVMKAHLESVGTPAAPGAGRGQVFLAYMEALCRDLEGRSFGVNPKSFLGKNADPAGKVDFQGCGELNPIVVSSAADARAFAAATDKTARDEAGAPNRRVVVYFFPPDTEIRPSAWPCPRATEGLAGCRLRLWSDAAIRRAPGENRREHPADRDTFACRFYDRLALEPIQAGSARLRLTVPGAAVAATTPVVLQTVAPDSQLALDPKEVTHDNLGDPYHVFELDEVRHLPSLAARLQSRPARPLVEPSRGVEEPRSRGAEAGAASSDQAPVPAIDHAEVGIDLISLLANLQGPAALARSLGIPVPDPPAPTPLEPPADDVPDVDDRDFFFENPLAPEQDVPLEFQHDDP